MNKRPRRYWNYVGLAILSGLSFYYLYRAVNYRFIRPDRLGPDLFNKKIWYFSHLILALPVVFGAPLQFIPPLRLRAPRLHRVIGKAYVLGASGAAVLAFYLGAVVGEYEGSRLSLALTSTLWLFFTLWLGVLRSSRTGLQDLVWLASDTALLASAANLRV